MTTPWAEKKTPRLLKATYLADQEFLLEETRASKFLYFPGPVAWTVVFGLLTYFSWAAKLHWTGISQFTHGLERLASLVHVHWSTFATAIAALFTLLTIIGLLWIAVRYVRWIRTVYAVTSRRVIVQKGILGRNFDEIPVTQVRGVDVRQSLGQRMLGYGTIRVSSEDAHIGNEDWVGIPAPFRFQKWVENATEAIQSPGSPPAVRP